MDFYDKKSKKNLVTPSAIIPLWVWVETCVPVKLSVSTSVSISRICFWPEVFLENFPTLCFGARLVSHFPRAGWFAQWKIEVRIDTKGRSSCAEKHFPKISETMEDYPTITDPDKRCYCESRGGLVYVDRESAPHPAVSKLPRSGSKFEKFKFLISKIFPEKKKI